METQKLSQQLTKKQVTKFLWFFRNSMVSEGLKIQLNSIEDLAKSYELRKISNQKICWKLDFETNTR